MHHPMVVEISCRYGGWGTDRGGVSQQGSQTGGRVSDPKLGLGGGLFHVAYLFIFGCTGLPSLCWLSPLAPL